MARFALASLLLLVVCLAPATAQETYDLRALKSRKPKAGDVFRETEHESNSQSQVIKNQGQVMQQQDEKEGYDLSRTIECVEVDEKGNAVKIITTFDSYKQLAPTEKDLEVKGLKLEFTRGADGKYTSKHLEGPELPLELKPWLESELKSMSKSDAEGKKSDEAMLPADAVAVGEAWDLDIGKVIADMEIPAEGLDKEKSSGKGVVVSIDTSGPVRLLILEINLKMTFNSFQGMKCVEPVVWDFVVKAQVSADGNSSTGSSETSISMMGTLAPPGAPARMTVTMDIQNNKVSKRVEMD